MDKPNATAPTAFKLQATDNCDHKLTDSASANQPNDANSSTGNTPSTVSNLASSAVSTNDVQLPFNNAPLDDEVDNNFEPTDDTDTDNQFKEMQLQSALEMTIHDYLADDEFDDMKT